MNFHENARRGACPLIQWLPDKQTELVGNREHVRKLGPDLQRMANRKLLILDAAENLNDLRVPPGNRLEQLQRSREGQTRKQLNSPANTRELDDVTPAGFGPALPP